jgi:hypothetical protein
MRGFQLCTRLVSFMTCNVAAAAIANIIRAIHSQPRQALPVGALESSEGSRTTKRSRRCLSRCVKLKPLPGRPTVVRVPVLPNATCAPRTPMDVEIPRLPKFRRIPGRLLIERRKRKPILARLHLQRLRHQAKMTFLTGRIEPLHRRSST